MADQRTVQQLIQSLTPGAVNNGNPNTIYNQAQPSTPPPILTSQGWLLNSINPAMTTPGTTLSYTPWMAPANSLSPNLPQWPTFTQPSLPTPSTPTPTTPVPTTPVPPPTESPQLGGSVPGISGGFGDVGCVALDQKIYGFASPESVLVGDMMPTVDPLTFKATEHEVTYAETKLQPCVYITTASGASLKCSTTAPLLLETGAIINAGELKPGSRIAVQVHGMYDYSVVETVEDVGEQRVRHITCGNQFFLAGAQDGLYILHHNRKFAGDAVDLIGAMDGLNSQFGWSRNTGGFGAASMGGGTPNTKGAMQANGTWNLAHGITPTTGAWDGSLTGSPEAWNGSLLGEAEATAIGGTPSNASTTPWANLGQPTTYEQMMYYNSLQGLGSSPNTPGQSSATQSSGSDKWGDWRNWLDLVLPGDVFQSGTGEWNTSNLMLGMADALFGLPVSNVVQRLGAQNLMQGQDGWTASAAQQNLQNQYLIADPAGRAKMVSDLSARYGVPAEQVLQRLGISP